MSSVEKKGKGKKTALQKKKQGRTHFVRKKIRLPSIDMDENLIV